MKTYSIALLPGDGVGPEVVRQGVRVLDALGEAHGGLRFRYGAYSVGAAEYLSSGDPMPESTFAAVGEHDATLMGAVGLPEVRWPNGTEMTPHLDLRERLGLYAGARPIALYHPDFTPLKGYEGVAIDMLVVRENTEGLFHSRKTPLEADDDHVIDSLCISRPGAERLFRFAFREAEKRRRRVTLVDQSNVLASMVFFRRVFDEVAAEFSAVRAERVYVDAAALHLVRRPEEFDVIVTENLFGDILSDLAAGLVGGMGMAPSADIGDRHAIFQPTHGSAPEIGGLDVANPTAAILSAAMMVEWLGEPESAERIREAVRRVFLDPENRTRDLGGVLSCTGLGSRVAAEVRK